MAKSKKEDIVKGRKYRADDGTLKRTAPGTYVDQFGKTIDEKTGKVLSKGVPYNKKIK